MTEHIKIKRLMNRDILIKHENTNKYTGSMIKILDDESKSELMYFKVLDVSPNVTMLKVGDIVILPWPRVMPPFYLNDECVTITSEDEVWGVIEGA